MHLYPKKSTNFSKFAIDTIDKCINLHLIYSVKRQEDRTFVNPFFIEINIHFIL